MARKLLSLVVALAMVLSSMSFAFAAKADPKAVSADVTDAKVKKAVEKLVTLGMVEGIDGKYVPDQKLKRSELTKLIVIALGMGPAADASKGSATQFSDVGADHWAAGYITVAAGQGLVQGMGDGTFAPDSEITFAQALTMLVRALGYKDEFLKGSWPGNYLAKASEKDLDEGVTIVPNAAVKRGDFAVMMSNTLDAEVVKINGYENDTVKYSEDTDVSLAKEKLKLDKAEVRLTGNARLSDLATDEVSGEFTKDPVKGSEIKVDSGSKLEAGGKFTLEFAEGLNPEVFLGITSNIYVKDKDTIVYIEDAGKSTEYWDGVDKFQGVSETSDKLTDVKLRWAAKVIPVLGGEKDIGDADEEDLDKYAKLYYTFNGETYQWNDGYASAFLAGQDYGRFVVENGKVVFADMFRFDNKDLGYMVKSVDAEDNQITYYEKDDESSIDLDNKYASFRFYLDAKEITIKDLKPFDVFYISEAKVDSKDVANIFVFRKVVEGTLTAVVTEDESTAKKVEIDSKSTTDLGKYPTYSYDNNEEISADGISEDYEDFVGNKVTLILGNDKKVRHIFGTAVSSESMYGVITGMYYTDGEYKVKVYTSNDEEKTYYFEEDEGAKPFDTKGLADTSKPAEVRAVDSLAELIVAVNDNAVADPNVFDFGNRHEIIKFKLTKDGKIAENSLVLYSPVKAGGDDYKVNGDFGDTTLKIASKTYTVKDNVKVFDIDKDLIVDDYTIATWENFKNKDVDNAEGMAYAIKNTAGDVEALFLLDGMDGLTTNIQSAYLLYTFRNADGDLFGKFQVYGSKDPITKEISGGVPARITKQTEAAVMINVLSSGKVDIYDSADQANADEDSSGDTKNWATVAGKVYDVDGKKLLVGASDTAYTVASDALVYNGKDAKSFSNVDEGDFVVAVVKDGVIESMEIFDIKRIDAPAAITSVSSDTKAAVSAATGYYAQHPGGSVIATGFRDIENKVVGVVLP